MALVYLAAVFFGDLAFGGTASGKIQEMAPADGNRFELTLLVEGSLQTFFADESTTVRTLIPVDQVQKGDRVAIPSLGGRKGTKGFKSPFSQMSPGAKKFLGLPDIPDIPDIPPTNEIPKVSKIPPIPEMENKSRKEESVQPETAMPGPDASLSQPEKGNEQASKSEGGQEIPDLPQDRSFTELHPKALSKATAESQELMSGRVQQVKKSEKGIVLQLDRGAEKSEEVSLAPSDAVFQFLDASDLKPDMQVELLFDERSGESVVREVTIA